MHAVLHSVWPIQVEYVMVTSCVQMTQKAEGAATGSVARAPYCLALNRGEVPSLLTFCATKYSTMMPLQSRSPICTGCTTMHGKLMHNHVRIAFPAAKNDYQARSLPNRHGCRDAHHVQVISNLQQLCLRTGLNASLSGHHSRSARPVTMLCISVHLYGLVSKSLMLPPSAWLVFINVPENIWDKSRCIYR